MTVAKLNIELGTIFRKKKPIFLLVFLMAQIYGHHKFFSEKCFFCGGEELIDRCILQIIGPHPDTLTFFKWFFAISEIVPHAKTCNECCQYLYQLAQLGYAGLGGKNVFQCSNEFVKIQNFREKWTVSPNKISKKGPVSKK